jgi:hypothetical protein
VQRLVRRRVASCVQEEDDGYEVILVDVDGTVAAVCVLAKVLDGETCDLVVVAIANDYQGEQVETDVGSMPLVRAAIETLLARARELGASRARAIVARENERSVNMLTKGLSRKGGGEVSFLEGDQAAGELEEGEVVLVFLRPADEDRPVAVQP